VGGPTCTFVPPCPVCCQTGACRAAQLANVLLYSWSAGTVVQGQVAGLGGCPRQWARHNEGFMTTPGFTAGVRGWGTPVVSHWGARRLQSEDPQAFSVCMCVWCGPASPRCCAASWRGAASPSNNHGVHGPRHPQQGCGVTALLVTACRGLLAAALCDGRSCA
jgi:hypothetical protein